MNKNNTDNVSFVMSQWDSHRRPAFMRDEEDDTEVPEPQDTLQPAPQTETTQETETPESPTKIEAEEPKSTPDHNWEKRYSDLRKLTSDKDKQILELKKTLDDAKKIATPLPKTKEDLQSFKSSHGELYDTIYSMIKSEMIESSREISEQFATLEEQQRSLSATAARMEVKKYHSDLDDILASVSFTEWFNSLTPAKRALVESDNVEDVVDALTRYKTDKGLVKSKKADEKKEEQKQAALAVTNSSKGIPAQEKKIWTESEINKMTPAMFSKFENEINQAQREGRIQLDITGRR